MGMTPKKPVVTKRNIMIFGFLMIVVGMFVSGWFHAIYKIITGDGEITDEVKLTAGAAFMALGPWVVRFSSFVGE